LLDPVFDLIMRNGRNHTSPLRKVTFLLILTACLFSHLSHSQKITNVDFEVIDNAVKITYDIGGCSGDKNYDIRVLLGRDGKLTEISRGLSGDLENVPCGSSNTITWDVLSDRQELRGRIYFAVEVLRTHSTMRGHEESKAGKPWSRKSWKADKGYVGGSIGTFTPYESYLATSRAFEQNGLFLNTTIGYLPTYLLGICSTIYIYGGTRNDQYEIVTWANYGMMIGPLISFPIGNKIKWELRPQIGYSFLSTKSDQPDLDSLGTTTTSGVAYNIGTGLRLNLGKRTCYLLNLEYLSAPRKPYDYLFHVEPDFGTLGASIGVAFRFY
jgi:hypothetical protein